MKIALGSPDGLGDFVLRMPLVEALVGAGHELQLVMRPPAADLARALFPEVEVVKLEEDPYSAAAKKLRRPFRSGFREIKRFAPQLYVAGAFQLNFFDEIFLEWCAADLQLAGFVCAEAPWYSDTAVDPQKLSGRFTIRCSVPTELPEGEKNRRMARALLGTDDFTETPLRQASEEHLKAASALLERHNLGGEGFVVVCAGSRPGLVMKDWGEKNWAALLEQMPNDGHRIFVFVGNPKESDSIERLRAALPSGVRSINLASDPPPIPVSYALVSMAQAYLGRDSGVMHMAAATNVLLLAVFSGAHWPRFLPEASRGIILTRQAPCRGCNFYCPFPEPWCVTTVPVEAVADAWGRLGDVRDLEVIELPVDEAWLSTVDVRDFHKYFSERAELRRRSTQDLVCRSTLGRMRQWLGERLR